MNEQEQMHYIHEVYDESLPRHGPGDDDSTLRALQIVLSTSPQPAGPETGRWRVMDLGCGTGAPTLVLAGQLRDATILAIDNYQAYLDELRRRADIQGLSRNISTRLGDMRAMEPGEGAFELIWSEGALFCMGFREGLRACYRWLSPHGLLAATELCWLKPDVPAECREFFTQCYPAMADIEDNLRAMRACGYRVVAHFTLPELAWWNQYYLPLEQRLSLLRQEPVVDDGKLEVMAFGEREIDMYRRYSDYYGYVFYVLQR